MNKVGNKPKACPICKNVSYHAHRLGLVQCAACGVVLSPAIWEPNANETMEQEWFGEDAQTESTFWINLFNSWNNRKTLDRLAQALPPGRRLLEIGVGGGAFLVASQAKGYKVMGCDLSSSICKHVSASYGIEMHNGHLAELVGENRFDVVVTNHVIEHVNQPVEFLKDVRRLLAPGGVVHIAVPNVSCWQAKLSGWTSYEPYHLAYLDTQTLTRIVSAGGLTIDRIATHDSFSGWFLAVLRTMLGVNRAGGAVTRPDSAPMGRAKVRRQGFVYHGYSTAMVFTGAVMWPLRVFQAQLGHGDEIICIARKH